MKRLSEFGLQALHLFTLSSFAIAQPLLDVLSGHAAFFVAHHSQPVDILLFVLVWCGLLPTFLVTSITIIGVFSPSARKGAHALAVAALVAIIALHMLKRGAGLPGTLVMIGAATLGMGVAAAYIRFVAIRTFVSALSPAVLLFPGLFLLSSGVSKLVLPNVNRSSLPKADANTPVVMVVFDELAAVSLMDEQRNVDAARYPNFAALAANAHWFRTTSTVSDNTVYALPAIVSGRYPDPDRLPTAADYPRSLFTLLGGSYDLRVFESRTQLCPTWLCASGATHAARRLGWLLWDSGVVYLHVVLPADWAAALPDITKDWRGFEAGRTGITEPGGRRSRLEKWHAGVVEAQPFMLPESRPRKVFDLIDSIRPSPPRTLYFLHVLLPHLPYLWLPSGTCYSFRTDLPGLLLTPSERWHSDEWAVTQAWQRYLLQVGFVDTLLGKLIARLKAVDLYDRALIVVTADHGVSFRADDFRRPLTETNYQDIIHVPLFIKRPHQRDGTVSDRNVQAIDILPTIAQILGIATHWPMDGHSIIDGSTPDPTTRVVFRRSAAERLVFDARLEGTQATLNRQVAIFGTGRRPNGLFRVGPNAELVGQPIGAANVSGEARVRVDLDLADVFTDVDPMAPFVPAHITGRVRSGWDRHEPLDLAVAVNGTIRAVTRPWTFPVGGVDGRWSAVVGADSFRPGHNRVDVFVVERRQGAPVLARATTEPYTLTRREGTGQVVILSPTGQSISIVPGALKGVVKTTVGKSSVIVDGWAVDVHNGSVPETVLIFLDKRLLYAGGTGKHRPDLVRRFGNPAFRYGGFRYGLPIGLFERAANPEIRAFAVSRRGIASELSVLGAG